MKKIILTEKDNEELGSRMTRDEMEAWLKRKGMTHDDLLFERMRRHRRRTYLTREPLTDTALHVITPTMRTENLASMVYSITSATKPHNLSIRWHCIFKNNENRYNIINVYNEILDDIKEGWVHFLCDDNCFHPDLFSELSKAIDANPDMGAFIVSIFGRHGKVMKACPENMVKFGVDAAQTFIRRDIIGDIRYKVHQSFSADSKFVCDVYKKHPEKFVFTDKVLAYYERLTRDDSGNLYHEKDGIVGT